MTVFISYQRIDEEKARSISAQLSAYGVKTYLDVMDPLLRSEEFVTGRILLALEASTHLIAVVSQTTRSSWWVPFEIGVATHGARRITSYRRDTTELPEFLKIWPFLQMDQQLRDYARRYFEDSSNNERNYTQFYTESVHKSITTPASFHAALKRDFGQS